MNKKKIVMDLPIIIGLTTLSWAKIRMMEFAYDFLLKYLDKSDYQWMEMDTDSAYLALSSEKLEDLIKPEMKDKFREDYLNWFIDPSEPYTKRQPGLFKEEFRGTDMVCLCSKTYIAMDSISGKVKMSSKGLSHYTNQKTFDDFLQVLETRVDKSGINKGFQLRKDNQMWTYIQERFGLPYLYVKRRVAEDGITTEPLDI